MREAIATFFFDDQSLAQKNRDRQPAWRTKSNPSATGGSIEIQTKAAPCLRACQDTTSA
jgi:hypothetical protein